MYGIALDHLGSDVVHQYVGQEPSGRNFNELVLDYNSEFTCAFFAVVLTVMVEEELRNFVLFMKY
jgi:glutaminase